MRSYEESKMRTKAGGFTLVELIVVITILGILAAVAIPKFVALQVDARIAKMNGALGSMKVGGGAGALDSAHARPGHQHVGGHGGRHHHHGQRLSGCRIDRPAAGISAPEFSLGAVTAVAGVNQIRIATDLGHPNCAIIYQEAIINGAPLYSVALDPTRNALDPTNTTDRANCA